MPATMVVHADGRPNIVIKFPKTKFNKYLKQIGLLEFKDLGSTEQIEKVYLLCFQGFKGGKLSTDDLSVISFNLFNQGLKVDKTFSDSEIFGVLLDGEELAFYLRLADPQFFSFLKQVAAFCNKNIYK